MTAPLVTVIVPTTGDRGPLLQHSVGSALHQTIREVEILVIGDGADDSTRSAAAALERTDSRVRFVDHPKSERRGEPYRHAVLQEAKGRFVCYLCDRDLWLPGHLEVMAGLLERYDFAATVALDPGALDSADRADHPPRVLGLLEPTNSVDRAALFAHRRGFRLSCTGHTLAFYQALPFGWRTTPAGIWTDVYMWAQCLAQPSCRAVLELQATVLYFQRGQHPGWPTLRREPELRHWASLLVDRGAIDAAFREAATMQLTDAMEGRRTGERSILIRGKTPTALVGRAVQRLASWAKLGPF